MTLKEIISKLRKEPKSALYFIQGNFNWFIHGKAIKKYLNKMSECPNCYKDAQCEKCGCDFNALALSSKKCKNG